MPELYKLQDEKPYIRIVKFNCNKENKELVSGRNACRNMLILCSTFVLQGDI